MNEPVVGDRRPLKTRETSWAQRLAEAVARTGLSPNGISVLGMIAGLLASGALVATAQCPVGTRWWWLLGALLVQMRLLANMLDGMVAVATRRTSLVGELYNEIPDRVSDIAILLGFGYAMGSQEVLGWLAACLAVFVAYVRAMGKAAGSTNEFCGPMAKPHRMFLVTVVSVFCGLAPAAWQGPWWGLGPAGLCLVVICLGCGVTSLRRLAKIARGLKSGGRNE